MFNKVQYQRSWKQYTRNAIRDTRKKHYAENEKHEQVIKQTERRLHILNVQN